MKTSIALCKEERQAPSGRERNIYDNLSRETLKGEATGDADPH